MRLDEERVLSGTEARDGFEKKAAGIPTGKTMEAGAVKSCPRR
jgi:hypothetical protein